MRKFLLGGILSLITICSFAQSSREYIKEQIKHHDNCRNVAITRTNGDVMLYGRNGWAANACPTGLTNALYELNQNDEYIDDVQLTEDGSWVILYGNNGLRWHNVPYSLEIKMKEYNENSEVITAITFNDAGDWIIITTEHFSASETWIMDFLKEGMNIHGGILTACISESGMVIVYENGFRTYGDVPQTLRNAISEEKDIDIYRLKFAGTSWFYADKKGVFHYFM